MALMGGKFNVKDSQMDGFDSQPLKELFVS
jgi:hypothetical protein